ncbi:abortive infection bacteriophage resistance protein, Abi superfamily [Psychroflexus gondwanensis ACAM 44]|uniref:Abortive infection bacteriophage resistance protein, Abi superfamily n=1 Tax=Psychroflexus gondwanensis ACAM 44 TaxID=1189619 RepID=N1WU04_9FLAO|nr:CPBP family intramembrane glutamic endopeptidase [Psychroflexus gondwanensis]EMY82470.1 abortive infection bacteriophage resistance protein, Abi superfamily [Psychroflexus gondwanensis ACAM 44]
MVVTKKAMLAMSIFTLFGFSGIAYFILSFSDEVDYFEMFNYDHLATSISIGLGFGAVAAIIGVLLLKLPVLRETSTFYAKLFKGVDLQWTDIVFYSLCAGVGEEILFRGALQPLMGLWWAAILFVVLHGYISTKDWKKSIYGVFLILISAGFGYLTRYFDIFSAMAAHFIFDVIMFIKLRKEARSLSSEID